MIVASVALGALLTPRICPPRCPQLPTEVHAIMCAPPAVADPLDSDAAWLRAEDVRYGGAARSGRGYCASYLPFTLAGNHSRAVLILGEPGPELRRIADTLALSCECVALLPDLGGDDVTVCDVAAWTHEALGREALAASAYLAGEHRVQGLAIVGAGAIGGRALELLASGGLEAHAAVALGPVAFDAARAARELSVPLLAVSADGALRAGLESNPLLGDDYFVVEEEPLGERAIALACAWVDRYVPEGLT